MDFGSALQHLRMGAQIRRTGWNGTGYFIYLVSASEFQHENARGPVQDIFKPGDTIKYRAHIDSHHADGSIGVWTPDQTDILADDWEFVPGPYANEIDLEPAPGHEFGTDHDDEAERIAIINTDTKHY